MKKTNHEDVSAVETRRKNASSDYFIGRFLVTRLSLHSFRISLIVSMMDCSSIGIETGLICVFA